MNEHIPDADKPSLHFMRDGKGTLYVDPVRVCRAIGIKQEKLTLQLLVWRSVALYLEVASPEDPQVTYLPVLMIPEFLGSLMAEPEHSSHLDQMAFFQHMFHQINLLTGQGAKKDASLWDAESMTHLHRFILSQISADRRERKREAAETECLPG